MSSHQTFVAVTVAASHAPWAFQQANALVVQTPFPSSEAPKQGKRGTQLFALQFSAF